MKNLSFIILYFLLLSCSHSDDIIVVQYADATGTELLSSAIFENIEIIPLRGDGVPLFDPMFVNMIVKNGTYYIADPQGSGKIYLFNANGEYLNSVGEMGRGPGEYLDLTDMIIENNGDVSVYSCLQGMLYGYTSQGRFIGNISYPYRARHFAKDVDLNYLYFGDGGGMPYQLYITDQHSHIVDSIWESRKIPSAATFSPVFSWNQDTLILCPNYGNEIYRFVGGKPEVSYRFDFGKYAIPAEYFDKEPSEGFAFIMTKTVALKKLFFENQKNAILLAVISFYGQGISRYVYGILEKATLTWRWYYINDGDFMNCHNLKYMDDSYVYFIVESAMIKEEEVIILKCRLARN